MYLIEAFWIITIQQLPGQFCLLSGSMRIQIIHKTFHFSLPWTDTYGPWDLFMSCFGCRGAVENSQVTLQGWWFMFLCTQITSKGSKWLDMTCQEKLSEELHNLTSSYKGCDCLQQSFAKWSGCERKSPRDIAIMQRWHINKTPRQKELPFHIKIEIILRSGLNFCENCHIN